MLETFSIQLLTLNYLYIIYIENYLDKLVLAERSLQLKLEEHLLTAAREGDLEGDP